MDDHHKKSTNIYYNVGINADQDATNPTIRKAHFIDTRGEIIVDKPSEYTLNVLNFSCPTDAIPIFIWPSTGTDGNKVVDNTQYSVTIEWPIGPDFPAYQTFLQYAAQGNEFPSTSEFYYYVHDYEHMIDMINDALKTSYDLLRTNYPGIGLAAGSEPYLTLDPVTRLVSYWSLAAYENFPINVYMSPKLFHMFSSFVNFNSPLTTSLGRFAYLRVERAKGDQNIVSLKGADWIEMKQEYPCLYQWNDLQSIILTSSIIPIRTEYVPSSGDSSASAVNDNTLRIVTSFNPIVEDGTSLKQGVTYTPSAQYKQIDIMGNSPLQLFDLNVSWIDKRNEIHQLYLSPYSQPVVVKILFERK